MGSLEEREEQSQHVASDIHIKVAYIHGKFLINLK